LLLLHLLVLHRLGHALGDLRDAARSRVTRSTTGNAAAFLRERADISRREDAIANDLRNDVRAYERPVTWAGLGRAGACLNVLCVPGWTGRQQTQRSPNAGARVCLGMPSSTGF
jgi:hypothetical protein